MSFLVFVSAAADSPSFPCGGQLNDTEAAICADAELAAYDRAVALLYGRAREASPNVVDPRLFLRERNACRQWRSCIAAAYRDWLDLYGWGILISGGHGNYRTLPASFVDAFLYMTPVGTGWYLFRTSTSGTESRPSSFAGGLVRINGGTGRFVERRGSTACSLNFEELADNQWQITDNGGCGVAPLTGRYGPHD